MTAVAPRRPSIYLAAFLAAGCLTISSFACTDLLPQRTEGERLYRKRCASCHGLDARGNTPKYLADATADLTDDDTIHGNGDHAMAFIITNGVMGRMPANPDLTQEQVQGIVTYLKALIHQSRAYS